MPTLAIIIQHSTRSPCNCKSGKEEVKLSLFTDGMILYMENPKESTPKLLEVIEQFSNVAGYKINAQKSVHFYTRTMRLKKEKLGNPFHLQ